MADIKKKDNKLAAGAVDFQPDAIEIKNERLPLWARYSVLFSVLFFLIAILWACFGKVDVVVKAPGKLVSDKQNIVMKPLERAIISKIHVRIGDVVEKDQPLITLDPTLNEADAERLKNEIEVLEAKYDRLRAEFEGKSYRPKSNSSTEKEQLVIFEQRTNYFKSRIRYFDEAIKQFDASEKTRKDSYKNQQDRLVTVRKMEKMYEELREKGAATLKELWNVQITRIEMEGNLETIRNGLLELSHQKESTVSSKDSFIHEWYNSISEDMVAVDRELDKNRKAYTQARNMLDNVILRSPCKAVVHEIASFPEGSAVREAEALITLIPVDGKIELEAEVTPRDIGKVLLGSEVRIKLGAYPFQKHGTLYGAVRNISEDTLSRQMPGSGDDGMPRNTSYYRALVSVNGKLHGVPANFRLIPGMEVEAEIKTGRRRIIEYLIYPLIKALDESAREP